MGWIIDLMETSKLHLFEFMIQLRVVCQDLLEKNCEEVIDQVDC